MKSRDKRYRKLASAKAKEYLRKKRGYKSKEEKKAFKLAEKFRLKQWKVSLAALEKEERTAQLKAYRVYLSKINFVRNLIICGALLLALAAAAVVLLLL